MKRPNFWLIAALLFAGFVLFSNYIWFKNDNSIVGVDSPNHLFFSIEFFYAISEAVFNSASSLWQKTAEVIRVFGAPVKHSSVYWPNGLNLNAAIFYFIFGKSLFAAKLSLLPYLFILLIATYLIGKAMHSGFTGFLAGFILFMYPLIFESSRQFQLDFPLTAMVALNILLLLKSEDFKNRMFSFLFGIFLGWAMLIKGQAILFIFWPLVFVLFGAFTKIKADSPGQSLSLKVLGNIFIFTITAVLVTSLWWGDKIGSMAQSLNEHVFNAQKAAEASFTLDKKYSLESIGYHVITLYLSSLGPFFFAAFIFSLPVFLKRKIRQKSTYLVWLIIPLLLFSLVFSIKHARFLMPVLPAIALITAYGISQIKNKYILFLTTVILICVALTQFYILSFVDLGRRDNYFKHYCRTVYEASPPRMRDLKIEEISEIIKKYSSGSRLTRIGWVSFNQGSGGTFETVFWLKMQERIFEPINLTEMHQEFLSNFNSLDYILFQVPFGSSLAWPGGDEFRVMLKATHTTTIQRLEAIDNEVWNEALSLLGAAKADFSLAGKVFEDDYIYYIYKKITSKG